MIAGRLPNGSRRAAFTLVECLGVMWGLGVCMALGVALLVTLFRFTAAEEQAGNRLNRRAALATRFRADVGRAESAPERSGDRTAGAACLILRMPGGAEVVYVWRDNTLERIERSAGKESRHALPVEPDGTRLEFVRSGNLITLRTAEPVRTAPARRREVSAVLGGDWR